jgi:hypothetical protein
MVVTALLTGAAMAHDYIVVNSTDPAIAKGATLNGGAVVPLASGRLLTVMSASGDLSTYRGGDLGVTLPRPATATEPGPFDALAALVRRPAPRRITGAMRGPSACAPAPELTTLEQIVAANAAGCTMTAKIALDAYIERSTASEVMTK